MFGTNKTCMNLNPEILNIGLDFSMEFGENWLKPINQRLLNKFPNLNLVELEKYNSVCKEVNNIANDFVYDNPAKNEKELTFIEFSKFENFMLQNFSWISKENLKRLYNQSCYYAYK
ncbi:MAG: hypothetical protein DI598_20510 [Pseudopedobacter saltans]|uniref:Uncharacterized protein n=1 Tax=Pseudopedobacter saltans TaxID=151895 RepID=A0A2W5FZQ3_9SPHI|nr:MAG: hypothetical protein DI598_20510 [Pseudopedobacter saltans]